MLAALIAILLGLQGPGPSSPPEYDRKLWKHWIDADDDCQSTRQEVLIRDSEVPVTFKTARQCRVATGRWTCPYTGAVVDDPSKVDVDHLVAREDAHESGGHSWIAKARRRFANDLRSPEHLLATSRSANRSKGAKGPDEWLPPLETARCDYLEAWLGVKEAHELTLSEGERAVTAYMARICEQGGTPPLPQRTANRRPEATEKKRRRPVK